MSCKIIINARFLTQNISGVQRYAIEISKQLRLLFPEAIFLSPNNIIHHKIAEDLNVIKVGKYTGHIWEQVELPFYLNRFKKYILINLANTAPILASNLIVTIHDLAVWDFPRSYNWKFRFLYKSILPIIAKKAKLVVTVSEFSKNNIGFKFNLPESQIIVIPNAVSDDFHPVGLEKQNFVLAVSSRDLKKNFKGIIEGFRKADLPDYKLILVGSENSVFSEDKVEVLSGIGLEGKLEFTGYLSDENLIKLYQTASVFVYPSFYEGFGIPPLEAMKSGCPVIVSNIQPLKEVCGDSAIYINPQDPEELGFEIKRLINNKEFSRKMVDKGIQQANKFSWRISGERFCGLIQKVISDV